MPKLISVHCSHSSPVWGERSLVLINPDQIVSLLVQPHHHEGKEVYYAILTMTKGRDYFITQEDYQRILEAVEP